MNKLEKHRYFINYEKLINDVNNSQKKLEKWIDYQVRH